MNPLIEDVEWMLATGEVPCNVATRLGMTPHAIEKAMRRAGRRDLAAPFSVEHRTQRRKGRQVNPLPPKQQARLDQLLADIKRGGHVDYDAPDVEGDDITDAQADREYAADADRAADRYDERINP